ncbi:hypothetical protein C8F01DRAFT_1167220 [Mycena amicta]|nr:hypothetical protein C8F01DRAFT_1167220 [Mycena amicta]
MSSHPALRARLAEVDRNLGQLADQVARLEAQISSLRAEKIDLERELVYPILTLPTEITSEILIQTVAVTNPFAVLKCPSPHYALTLASVCGAWRDVALSSCALWNQITLDCRHTSDPVSIFNCWASRSGNLPLDICVCFGREKSAIRIAKSLFTGISCFAPRWRTLSFLPQFTSNWLELPWVFENLKNLRSLSMESRIHWLDQSSTSAPALREMSLHLTSLPIGMLNSRALQNLRILNLSRTPPLETMCILECTPALEVLRLSMRHKFDRRPEPLVLPALRSLTCERDKTLSILDSLSLPALQSFVMSRLQGDYEEIAELIRPFIVRSQCQIDHLSFRTSSYIGANTDTFPTCLDLFPHIRTLTLAMDLEDNWPQGLIRKFVSYVRNHGEGDDHNSRLSNLETLILRGPTIDVDFTELVDWVRERARDTRADLTKMRRLEIHFLDRLGVPPGVHDLVSVGVHVETGTVSWRESSDSEWYLD